MEDCGHKVTKCDQVQRVWMYLQSTVYLQRSGVLVVHLAQLSISNQDAHPHSQKEEDKN